jgi:hypothetical protein
VRLFLGDDWAETHHDVEVKDTAGRRLAKARLPEGVTGMARLHAMIGELVSDDPDEDVQVLVGIGHNAALRQLANRLVGILHGCLKTGTHYDETTAWSHHVENVAA